MSVPSKVSQCCKAIALASLSFCEVSTRDGCARGLSESPAPLRRAQPGIDPPRDARRLGRPDLAARQCCPDPAYRALHLLPRADRRQAEADPLGRILRRAL